MSEPKNVVLWGCHSPSAVTAIKSLHSENKIAIGAWFGNAKECTHRLNPFLHQFKIDAEPTFTKAAPPQLTPAELVIFLDMYSRVSRSRGLSTHELRHTAQIYYRFFSNLIEKKKTEVVVFSSPPHFGVDFLLYLAAKKHGVDTVFCYQTLFPNRFFVCRSIEDFGIFNEYAQNTPLEHIAIERSHKKNLFYMKSIKHRPERALLSAVNDFRRNVLRSSSKPMSMSGIIEKYRETRDWNQNTKKLTTAQVDFNAKFVYFPLQLQPEMTTSTLGSDYSDQLSAIEVINDMIPDDWFIYVKENPKQTHRQRGDTFMRRLHSIAKVKYLERSVNTYELLERSQFAATVTGTVGWESISGGKPALVFGRPWYVSLPGIVPYRMRLKVTDVLNHTFSHEEVEGRLSELLSKGFHGVIDPGYIPIVKNYNEENNTHLIRNFFEKAFSGSIFLKNKDANAFTQE